MYHAFVKRLVREGALQSIDSTTDVGTLTDELVTTFKHALTRTVKNSLTERTPAPRRFERGSSEEVVHRGLHAADPLDFGAGLWAPK